jgi:hypothetical protein
MNSSMRGAYLSGLVYPGLGQIVQKNYVRGIALICVVTASLAQALITFSSQATAILARIESHGGDVDLTGVLRETVALAAREDSGTMKMSSVLILGCWVIGIADAYLSGKRIDARTAEANKAMPGLQRADPRAAKGVAHVRRK